VPDHVTAADDQVAAPRAVPRDHYVAHARLGAVPQATAQTAIERDLRRADVRPGEAVLEIGTGTGLTGALLAELAGPSGRVVSVDIDPALIRRARELHAERNVRNITLVTGDGNKGAPGYGPFDVIIAWATPAVIPRAWLNQARPGTRICTPVYFAETARSSAHVCATVTTSGGLANITLGTASYVDMGGQINTSFKVPMFYIDAVRDCRGEPTWISVAWRGRHVGHDPRRALEILAEPGYREPWTLAPGMAGLRQAWRDFRAYCAARDHGSNLTSHGTADGDNAIGFSSGNNAAVLTDSGTILANAAASPALAKLRDRLEDWDDARRPGLADLMPTTVDRQDGAAVRLTLPAVLGAVHVFSLGIHRKVYYARYLLLSPGTGVPVSAGTGMECELADDAEWRPACREPI
jgi:protein-L-isoaspartate(D-aspartate) O-methyltransferase